jgi:uncharacterized FAD-dependent dehydrogenase
MALPRYLIDAHHIGTNKLPQIIQDISEKILSAVVSFCLKQELLIF